MKLSFRKAPFEKKRKFYNYGEVGSPVLPLIDYHEAVRNDILLKVSYVFNKHPT